MQSGGEVNLAFLERPHKTNMRATVSHIRFDGVILEVPETGGAKRELWLPGTEWSRNVNEWEAARETLNVEEELDVVPITRSYEGRLVVSRKGVTSKAVVDSSTTGMLVRDMRVADVGRRVVRGVIGYDTPGVVTRQSFETYLDWVSNKSLSQDLQDHAVLSKGDFVRGFVKGMDQGDDLASVNIDIGEYLDLRAFELERAVMAGETPVVEEQDVNVPRRNKMKAADVAKISPCLLVDDDQCRESIANVLEHEGIEIHMLKTTAEAEDFLGAISKGLALPNANLPFRLAILDPNLEEHGADLIGLRVASELSAKTDCRIIVMTGEVKNTIKLEHWPDLGIHGYIEKPFTMDQLIGEIEDSLGLDDAVPLSQWIKTDARDLSNVSVAETAVDNSASGELSISEALRPLAKLKPGVVLHVFELHPRSFRARSLGSVSGTALRWEGLRGKIAKSVIKDAALSTSPIVEGNAENNELRHLWTLEMMRYQSFCGLPIHVKGKLIALVAFHPDRNVFDPGFVGVARIFTERVSRIIERQTLYHTRRNEAELASFGMALAALAHELASDMTALNANLKRLSDIAVNNVNHDPGEKGDALLTLSRIRGNVDVITRKTKILRRTHVRSERVSLGECLRKAAKTCRTVIDETMKHPERILVKEVEIPKGDWNVNASEASLIIVFFNLYLNAAQQIELTSSVRRYGLIWNSLVRFKDAKGKSWARARIHDSGPGIHGDDWEQVFDPGYSTKPDGSGLGLYICRYLLKDCLGNIAVTASAIWDGTVVTVTLPLAD